MRYRNAILAALFLIAAPAIKAQQGRPPAIVTHAWTPNDAPLDSTLDWISEYRKPPIYLDWFREIASCEGLPLPIEKARTVQFFQVNAPEFVPEGVDAVVYAVTFAERMQNPQVYVAYPFIWNRHLVEHEILHLLLFWAGDPYWWEHDPIRFEACGLASYGPPLP